jgi:integrase
LVEATAANPFVKGMTGPDRAMLYALAAGTGFRREELRTLTPEQFNLDSDPPTVRVLACYAKNGREAVQPLPHALADRLVPWLDLKAPGRPVFEGMTKRTADEMLAIDLKAAGIEPESDSGIVDFHALRGTYISHLVSSGASVKTCQTLARHSSPVLTIGIYAKASLHDIAGAVESLPDLTPTQPHCEALSATGTEGGPLATATQSAIPTIVDGTQSHKLQNGFRHPCAGLRILSRKG